MDRCETPGVYGAWLEVVARRSKRLRGPRGRTNDRGVAEAGVKGDEAKGRLEDYRHVLAHRPPGFAPLYDGIGGV